MADFGTSPIRSEQRGARSSAPTFQWLPDPWGSTLHEAGAPTGTPLFGATAEIEASMNSGIWNWHETSGETYDERWFHFVHRKPLRVYEIEPAFTMTADDGAQGGQPVNLM